MAASVTLIIIIIISNLGSGCKGLVMARRRCLMNHIYACTSSTEVERGSLIAIIVGKDVDTVDVGGAGFDCRGYITAPRSGLTLGHRGTDFLNKSSDMSSLGGIGLDCSNLLDDATKLCSDFLELSIGKLIEVLNKLVNGLAAVSTRGTRWRG
jgi:hypothetical protein